MDESSFEKLAAEAAAGLQGDRELFLDVTQELRSHLDDKAHTFVRQGKTPDESVELARKAFGSPVDVAAELLEANRGRMRLRGWLRLAFGAVVVPLAIILAFYVGYGRLAQLQNMAQWTSGNFAHATWTMLPTLPFFSGNLNPTYDSSSVVAQLVSQPKNAPNIYHYWDTHRNDPDSKMVYAYYALFLEAGVDEQRYTSAMTHDHHWLGTDEQGYVSTMRHGEQLEPNNALYNVLLAHYYLSHGMTAKREKMRDSYHYKRGTTPTDDLLDRRTFELGIAELQKAVRKPYLRTYHSEILQKKIHSLPRPSLTEDYLQRLAIDAGELLTEQGKFRVLSEKIPGCARILLAEGRKADAETVMDTWRPYASLLTGNATGNLIEVLIANAAGMILSQDGADIYQQLGAQGKAQQAQEINLQLTQVRHGWKSTTSSAAQQAANALLREHGPIIASQLFSAPGDISVTARELTPGRMHEHVLMEEIILQILLLVLLFTLIGTLMQGKLWLDRTRGSASVPLLLLPPAPVLLRTLCLGVIVPIVVYWLYSRCPLIGGREYSVVSWMWPRFAIELLALIVILLWLPAHLIRRYIRRRCDELAIAMPDEKEERKLTLIRRGGITVAVIVAAIIGCIPISLSPQVRIAGVVIWLGIFIAVSIIAGLRRTEQGRYLGYIGRKRAEYGLYYGTLARSLAPVYAFSIILLSLIAQPWLMYNEARWLHKDTIGFGYQQNSAQPNQMCCSAFEARKTQQLRGMVEAALQGNAK